MWDAQDRELEKVPQQKPCPFDSDLVVLQKAQTHPSNLVMTMWGRRPRLVVL